MKFLQTEIQRRERSEIFKDLSMEKSNAQQDVERKKVSSTSALQTLAEEGPQQCVFCQKRHKSEKCNQILRLDILRREEKVKSLGLCFKCLVKGHMSKDCRGKVKCAQCTGYHNILFCRTSKKIYATNNSPSRQGVAHTHSEQVDSTVNTSSGTVEHVGISHDQRVKRSTVLQTAKIKTLTNNGKSIDVIVMFDLGADTTYVSHDIVRRIKAKWVTSKYTSYSTFGNKKSQNRKERNVYDVKVIDTQENLIRCKDLVAFESVFCWILSGSCMKTQEENVSHQMLCMNTAKPVNESKLHEFWSLESIGICAGRDKSPKDPVLDNFENSVKFVDGRYEVALPWKSDVSKLSLLESETGARKRLATLNSKFERNPSLRIEYDKVLKSYEDSNIIEKVPQSEMEGPYPIYYMPHRPIRVQRSDKDVFVAVRTIHTLTVQELQENLYVDDWLSGADTVEEANTMFCEAQSILSDAGMTLSKWNSNSKSLTHQLNQFFEVGETTKLLGMHWKAFKDVFSFKGLNLDCNFDLNFTKRNILSLIARLFDPFGLISPFTMYAKILFQEIWRLELGWDEILSHDLQLKCQLWIDGIQSIKTFEIHRNYYPDSSLSSLVGLEVHAFSDASEKGYGSCVYLRIPKSDKEFHVSFVMARTKVAPIKRVTLPRLELLGTLLSARLSHFVKSALRLHDCVRLVCWIDSKVALSWIKGNANRWKMFVANRVTEIQTLTSPSN
ncbi:uncharacterized protein LOC143021637 [Oratosquilla oratoria]|uniref:uncharacterized protein LOC143021637 n=1 Tax=Oratosquilla oratoria TaxID=337810 RepID=UPI003F757FE9